MWTSSPKLRSQIHCRLKMRRAALISFHEILGFQYIGVETEFAVMSVLLAIFIESAHWVDSIIESRCPCVCVSVCLSVPFNAIFFEASYWPSDHMTRSRPLIGQPSFPTIWWWWGEGEGEEEEEEGGSTNERPGSDHVT